MIEWPLIFMGGLLGSSHCVGMCGAFAVTVGLGAPSAASNLRRQLVYTAGRLFTYSFAGAVVGAAGMRLARLPIGAVGVQTALAVAAGTLLIVQGLRSAGLWPRLWKRNVARGYCPAQSLFASFLTAPGWQNAFLAGLLTGFLPCGLVYAFLALAASSGTLWTGMIVMALFGSGTVPLMVLTGVGTSLLTFRARQRLLQAAAFCVIVTGFLTVTRAAGWARPAASSGEFACPFCASTAPFESSNPVESPNRGARP